MDKSLFKYGLIAVDPEKFINSDQFDRLHLVGYETPPNIVNYHELYQELQTGILKGVDFILVPATTTMINDVINNEDDFTFEIHEGSK